MTRRKKAQGSRAPKRTRPTPGRAADCMARWACGILAVARGPDAEPLRRLCQQVCGDAPATLRQGYEESLVVCAVESRLVQEDRAPATLEECWRPAHRRRLERMWRACRGPSEDQSPSLLALLGRGRKGCVAPPRGQRDPEATCSKCVREGRGQGRVYSRFEQTRGGDEGETAFKMCAMCGSRWTV